MGSNCFTPIRGRRMRATRVDTLGRPVPGPGSTIVTSGFVSVAMSAQVEAGNETTVRNAGGEICVAEKGADQLKWLDVSMVFCQVDPDLVAMINPTWTKLLDYQGQTIGWEESRQYSVDTGISLEVWSDVSGYTSTDPMADGAWVYYLLPYVVGGTLGDFTVEDAAISFTLTGRTKAGSQWGKGPYDVMRNAPDGQPGPLITPFNPDAPRRVFLTTVKPPAALCGAQPLSHSQAPQTTATEVTTDATRMTVQATVSGVGAPFTINWGDGTVEDMPTGVAGKTHLYGETGTYIVQVYPTADNTKVSYQTVTLPFTGAVPDQPLTAVISEDTTAANRLKAKVDWTNTGFGTVKVDWGDGTSVAAQAETGNAAHAYTAAGTYTVRITDETDASRSLARTVEVPFGPVITAAKDTTDATGKTTKVTVDNAGHGNVTIDWGDAKPTTTNAGNGSATSTHAYTANGTYTVKATDVDEPARTGTVTLTIPYA